MNSKHMLCPHQTGLGGVSLEKWTSWRATRAGETRLNKARYVGHSGIPISQQTIDGIVCVRVRAYV